jgi:hypothetical protein
MTDLTPFEQRLSERLGVELTGAAAPFDPAAIAGMAIARRSMRDRLLNRLAFGPLPMATARKTALVTVAALLALVMIALAVGMTRLGGPRLVFIRLNGDVVLAAPDGSSQTVIYRIDGPDFHSQISLAPGGQHVAVVDQSFQLLIINRSGEVTYSRTLETWSSRFAWAPDGQRLAVFDGPWAPIIEGEPARGPLVDPLLDIVRTDGTLEWTAPLPAGFRYDLGFGHLAWSPDGRSIAILGSTAGDDDEGSPRPSSVWIVETERRTIRELTTSEPGAADHQPTWRPDGLLLFARYNSGIVQVDPETGATSTIVEVTRETCTCSNPRVELYDVSPDGTRLALRHPTAGLAVLDLATGALIEVRPALDGFGGQAPIKWTPDGSALVVDFSPSQDEVPSVVVLDIVTGEHRVIVPETRFFDVSR